MMEAQKTAPVQVPVRVPVQMQPTGFKVHVKTVRASPQQAQHNVWAQHKSVPVNTVQHRIQPPQQFQGGYRPPQNQNQITPYQYKQINPKNANVAPVKVLNSRLRR